MAVPNRLKTQEYKYGSSWNKPPIPYIPEKDKPHQAVDNVTIIFNFALQGKVESRIPVGSHRTPKQFITHVKEVINAIKQQSIKAVYNKLIGNKNEYASNLKSQLKP